MVQRHALVGLLKSKSLSWLLITNLVNIRYLTGLNLSAGALLIAKNGSILLFVDSRYIEAAKSVKGGLRVSPITQFDAFIGTIRRCGCESASVTLGDHERWTKKYKNTKFIHTFDLIEGLRRTKSSIEIAAINAACSVTRRVMNRVPSLLAHRMTERELAWRIRERCHAHGADELAFETIVAFGSNTSKPHHHPSDMRLKKRDIIQIDMGVKLDDYCSDMSRVFFVGSPSDEQRRCLRALKGAKKMAESMLHPGITNHALDAAARSVLSRAGIDHAFTHALGHGLGLEIHEGITLSARAPIAKLLKREAVTIEPGVYFPGKWGMRIEDTYVVS